MRFSVLVATVTLVALAGVQAAPTGDTIQIAHTAHSDTRIYRRYDDGNKHGDGGKGDDDEEPDHGDLSPSEAAAAVPSQPGMGARIGQAVDSAASGIEASNAIGAVGSALSPVSQQGGRSTGGADREV